MLCNVFRLRALGNEMSGDWVIENGPARGTLRIVTTGTQSRPRYRARLLDAGELDLLPPLDYASQESVEGKPGVVLVSGWEDSTQSPKSSRVVQYKQQWVCVPVTAAQSPLPAA